MLSGVAGDVTFYQRVTFSCDRRLFHGVDFVFPCTSERLLYEAIIEAMHRKYRHSNGPAASCGAVKPNLKSTVSARLKRLLEEWSWRAEGWRRA